jgi:large subunit ribosomal protein L3
MRKNVPDIFEIAIGGDYSKKLEYAESVLGKELKAADVLKIGEHVDASGVTKGRGFTGPVKRFGIRIQFRKDKQMHRHVGSIGSTTPRKVDWRVPAAGQYGFFTRTEFSKRVIAIGDDPAVVTPKGGFLGYGSLKSFILIEGSVPGHRKRLVRLRKSVREQKVLQPDVRYISVESKQG